MSQEPELTSLNVSLPIPLREFVQAQVAKGGYSSASEYIRELLRAAQKALLREEQLLLQGLDSGPARELTKEFWNEKKESLSKRHRTRKTR